MYIAHDNLRKRKMNKRNKNDERKGQQIDTNDWETGCKEKVCITMHWMYEGRWCGGGRTWQATDKVEKEDMIGWITCSKCNCARVIVMKKSKRKTNIIFRCNTSYFKVRDGKKAQGNRGQGYLHSVFTLLARYIRIYLFNKVASYLRIWQLLWIDIKPVSNHHYKPLYSKPRKTYS